VEFLVVPLAWRWAAVKWSPRRGGGVQFDGYRWEEAAPGGLNGYTTPEEEVTNG